MRHFVIVPCLLALSAIAQPNDNWTFIGDIHCGDATEFKENTYQITDVKDAALKITSMGTLCTIRINPTSGTNDKQEVKLMALDEGVHVWHNVPDAVPTVSAFPPIIVWANVRSLACACPPGRYADIIVYQK